MTQTVTQKPDPTSKRLFIAQIILVILLLAALALGAILEGGSAAVTPTTDLADSVTETPFTAEASPTDTVAASTPTATATPTPIPTDSPTPIATYTPPRESILRMGTGDSVFYPQKWIGPAVVRITFSGEGPLLVWTQNDNGDREELLTNSVGPYNGDSLIDLLGSQRTLRFEVRSSEGWQIEVLPLSRARHLAAPGSVGGSGDEVIVLEGPYEPDLLQVDASGATGVFTVWAYGRGRERVISSFAPYMGTVPIPKGTTALAIRATGPWSLDITIR